jgi:hypothetical protein
MDQIDYNQVTPTEGTFDSGPQKITSFISSEDDTRVGTAPYRNDEGYGIIAVKDSVTRHKIMFLILSFLWTGLIVGKSL